MFTTTLLYAGLLPMAAAALVAVVARQLRCAPSATWACSTALGFIAGLIGLKSQAGLAFAVSSIVQPLEAADWLPLIILLALGTTLVLLAAPLAYRQLALAIAALFVFAVPIRLLSGNARLNSSWSGSEKVAGAVLLAATLGIVWRLLAAGSEPQRTASRLVFLVFVAVGAAAVATLSGVLVYGQACGALASALTGTALATNAWKFLPLPLGVGRVAAGGSPWRGEGALMSGAGTADPASARPRFAFDGLTGAAGIITFSLGSLILLGRFFAEVSTANALLLLVALSAAGAPLPNTILGQSQWLQFTLRAVCCLVPLTVAIASTI